MITARAGLMTPADSDVRWVGHPKKYAPAAVFLLPATCLGLDTLSSTTNRDALHCNDSGDTNDASIIIIITIIVLQRSSSC